MRVGVRVVRVVVAVVALVVLGGWARYRLDYKSWNLAGPPARVQALGRVFWNDQGSSSTRAQVAEMDHGSLRTIGTVRPFPFVSLASRPIQVVGKDSCVGVVYVRFSQARYVPYGLSGGC